MIPLDPKHECTKFWATEERQKVRVKWGTLAALFENFHGVRGARRTWAGVCGYRHRVFHLSTIQLCPLTIQDIYITPEKGCEEGRRCLARQCPLNRTSDASLRRLLNAKPQEPLTACSNLTEATLCRMFEERPTEPGAYLPRRGRPRGRQTGRNPGRNDEATNHAL
jgi:hypothetical protein